MESPLRGRRPRALPVLDAMDEDLADLVHAYLRISDPDLKRAAVAAVRALGGVTRTVRPSPVPDRRDGTDVTPGHEHPRATEPAHELASH